MNPIVWTGYCRISSSCKNRSVYFVICISSSFPVSNPTCPFHRWPFQIWISLSFTVRCTYRQRTALWGLPPLASELPIQQDHFWGCNSNPHWVEVAIRRSVGVSGEMRCKGVRYKGRDRNSKMHNTERDGPYKSFFCVSKQLIKTQVNVYKGCERVTRTISDSCSCTSSYIPFLFMVLVVNTLYNSGIKGREKRKKVRRK